MNKTGAKMIEGDGMLKLVFQLASGLFIINQISEQKNERK
jgi:hypothetical protein